MSVQAMAWVLEHSLTQLGSRLILLVIANHADAYGRNSWPDLPKIAREARMSVSSAIRCVKALEEGGHIDVLHDRGRGRRNTYAVIMDPVDIASRAAVRGVSGKTSHLDTLSATTENIRSEQENVSSCTENISSCEIPSSMNHPEPSEPPLPSPSANGERKRRTVKPDLLFEALLEAEGLVGGELTTDERGRVNRAAKQLRQVGSSPDEIARLARAHRAIWPDLGVTAKSLAANRQRLLRVDPSAPAGGKRGPYRQPDPSVWDDPDVTNFGSRP